MNKYHRRLLEVCRVLDEHIKAEKNSKRRKNGTPPLVSENKDVPHYFALERWAETNYCGTSACAVGSCALDSWFNKQGLFLSGHICPGFGVHRNWTAVEKFFNLTGKEATHIFSDISYPNMGVSAGQVKRRLSAFIRKKYGNS